MAFKMGGWSAFTKNGDEKESKRYYRKKTHVDPDNPYKGSTEETFGSGGREGDDPKKHKKVVLTKYTDPDKGDMFLKHKYKRGQGGATKGKHISESRYQIESGIRKFFNKKKKNK